MIKDIKNFILEDKFKVNIIDNKVDIVNYQNIDHFDTNKIIIRHGQGLLKVIGDNLIITRLLNDEILISGKIKAIELR